jgi:GrpB-like predicted nucleotidyltransferase (UPF0157 family)
MEVVRFDRDVAMHRVRGSTALKVGPLLGNTTDALVEILYLLPDVTLAWADLPSLRCLAVLDGSLRCHGRDGVERNLSAGYGALWDAGEVGSVVSTTDVTAVVVDGMFESWAVAVTKNIDVVPYNDAWPQWFDSICAVAWPAVSDVATRIDHVGSTSVPGLSAKPVIDLDVVCASSDDVPLVIDRLDALAYRWKGDLGVEGREAFSSAAHHDLPAHHLYVVVDGSRAHLNHTLLRDLLRRDPAEREAYGNLKVANAQVANSDMDVYVAAKAAYVARVLTRARAEAGLPPVAYWLPREPPTSSATEG